MKKPDILAATLLTIIFFSACGKKIAPILIAPQNTVIIADSICFERHIEPLLQICGTCHNKINPPLTTTLISYSDFVTNIDSIINATQARRMPKNGPYFSQGEVDTLIAWRTNGEKLCQ